MLRLRALPNNRITDKQAVTAEMLRSLPSTAQAGFRFTIKMNGKDGAVAENSLSNLAGFALFGQMTELVFNSVPPASGVATPFSFAYHINPFIQQWLGAFAGITRISFAASGTTNFPKDATNFLITGDFADAKWLSSMTRLAYLNLTAYANYQDERSIDERMKFAEWFSEFMSQQISSARSPSILIPKNSAQSNNPAVDTKIPSATITEGVNTTVAPPFYFYTVTTSQYIEYTKIPEPRIYFDPINGLTSNQLLVDDSYVDLFVKDSKLFWNYDQAYALQGTTKVFTPIDKNSIVAFYAKQQKFVTDNTRSALLAQGVPESDVPLIDARSAPYESITPRPEFEPRLNALNYDTALKQHFINDVPVQAVLYASQMILVSDLLPQATYFYENESEVRLFSDLATLLKLYPQDRWPNLGINQVGESAAPRSAYEQYKLQGLQSFADPLIDEYPNNPPVNVNGTTLTGDDIEIFESKPYWKLPDDIKPEQIAYFDKTAYYTKLDPTMDWEAGVYALKPREGYRGSVFGTRVTPQQFALTEASLPKIADAKLMIDDIAVPVIFDSGDTFYATSSINSIKYVTEGAGVQNWYTTAFKKEWLTTPNLLVYTVTRQTRRVGQAAQIIRPANGAVLRLANSDVSYPSVLISGEWRFWITPEQFNDLNFVDRSGNYYASVPSAAVAINEAFSSVEKRYDDNYIEEPDSRMNVSQAFDVLGNVQAAQEGFTIDNKRYPFVVKDGRAYIEPELFQLVNFISSPVDRTYFSSYSQMNAEQSKVAFTAIRKEDAAIIPGFKGVAIDAAEGQRTGIEVRDPKGFLRTTSVLAKTVGGTVVYEFSDVAVGSLIKYKGTGNRYLATLDNLQDSDGPVSQVLPFTVESLDASKAHMGLAEQSDKQIRTVIAGSVLGGLGLLGAAAGAARLFYLLRKRTK